MSRVSLVAPAVWLVARTIFLLLFLFKNLGAGPP